MFEKFKSIVLSSVIFVLCFAYNASATPINTSADILTSITVTELTPLNFGEFTVGAVGGFLRFDADGTINADPDITHLGGETIGVARLDTSGMGAATTVTVTVTGTTLVNGGFNMPIAGNCRGFLGVVGADNGQCTYTSQQIAADDVQIGGVLTVGAAQAPGNYTGTLEVVAGY